MILILSSHHQNDATYFWAVLQVMSQGLYGLVMTGAVLPLSINGTQQMQFLFPLR